MNRFKLHPNPKSISGDLTAVYVATLLNPVDHRLYDVIRTGSRDYHLVAPMPNSHYENPDADLVEYGEGSFDSYDEKELYYEGSTQDYYRSHTPSGVSAKKKGLGLLLYCGLSLGVVENKGGGGIFSQTSLRSGDATKWWESQVERGFAESETASVSGGGEVSIDIDEDMISDDVERLASQGYFGDDLQEAEHVTISDGPSPSSVEVEVWVEGETGVQFLPAVKVAESKLVIAWNSGDSDLDQLMEESGEHPSAEIVSEIDLFTVGDPELIILLWEKIKDSDDVSDIQRERFLKRIPRGEFIDKERRILELLGQQKLPFKEVAANAKKLKHSKAWEAEFSEFI